MLACSNTVESTPATKFSWVRNMGPQKRRQNAIANRRAHVGSGTVPGSPIEDHRRSRLRSGGDHSNALPMVGPLAGEMAPGNNPSGPILFGEVDEHPHDVDSRLGGNELRWLVLRPIRLLTRDRADWDLCRTAPNRFGHPPLIGVEVHGQSTRFDDIGPIAGEQILGTECVVDELPNRSIGKEITKNLPLVHQHPHTLVHSPGGGCERVFFRMAVVGPETSPILVGSTILIGDPQLALRLGLFLQAAQERLHLIGGHGIFDQRVTMGVQI